ncbi:MAG: molybdopterin-dependent oxidoreductase [Chloroflexi bacterium]|nr:molybdopterin-dependent oxidoreductase [Chloroflexota bacterium]
MSESNLERANTESSGMSAQNPNAGEMKYTRISYIRAGGLGALTSIPVMALGSLAEGIAGLTFTPFDLFDGLARVLPGDILTFGIDSLVSVITALNVGPTSEVAKIAERSMALVMFVAIGAAFGIVLQWLGREDPRQLSGHGVRTGALLAGAFWLVSVAVGFSQTSVWWVGLWFALLYVSWGWSLGWLIQRAGPALAGDPNSSLSRRDFVTLLGGSVATISVGSWVGASLFGKGAPPAPVQVEILDTSALVDSPTAEALAARIDVAPGTRLEITPNADFYRIDISTRRPRLAAETWRLELTGVVDRPLSLTLDEIRAMPSLSYHHTLSCISNRVGGDLISTTRWTGVLVRDVLETAGMRTTAEELFIEAADGFYESVSMSDLMGDRTIFAYEMNGAPLPVDHGFPLRIIIPNRYGMKQPKWIVNMELLDREGRGYWVERGWSEEAYVRMTSVIDTVATDAADEEMQTVPVGGIAHAGANGISRVEVQVDEGQWVEAELRAPALGPLTWLQWRYDWPRESGRHRFKVRAYDGSGKPQVIESNPVRPDGATGIHEVSATA